MTWKTLAFVSLVVSVAACNGGTERRTAKPAPPPPEQPPAARQRQPEPATSTRALFLPPSRKPLTYDVALERKLILVEPLAQLRRVMRRLYNLAHKEPFRTLVGLGHPGLGSTLSMPLATFDPLLFNGLLSTINLPAHALPNAAVLARPLRLGKFEVTVRVRRSNGTQVRSVQGQVIVAWLGTHSREVTRHLKQECKLEESAADTGDIYRCPWGHSTRYYAVSEGHLFAFSDQALGRASGRLARALRSAPPGVHLRGIPLDCASPGSGAPSCRPRWGMAVDLSVTRTNRLAVRARIPLEPDFDELHKAWRNRTWLAQPPVPGVWGTILFNFSPDGLRGDGPYRLSSKAAETVGVTAWLDPNGRLGLLASGPPKHPSWRVEKLAQNVLDKIWMPLRDKLVSGACPQPRVRPRARRLKGVRVAWMSLRPLWRPCRKLSASRRFLLRMADAALPRQLLVWATHSDRWMCAGPGKRCRQLVAWSLGLRKGLPQSKGPLEVWDIRLDLKPLFQWVDGKLGPRLKKWATSISPKVAQVVDASLANVKSWSAENWDLVGKAVLDPDPKHPSLVWNFDADALTGAAFLVPLLMFQSATATTSPHPAPKQTVRPPRKP